MKIYEVVLRIEAEDANLQSVLQLVPASSIQATWSSAERAERGLAAGNFLMTTENDWVALNLWLAKFLSNSGNRLRKIVDLSSGVELDVGVFCEERKAVTDIDPRVLRTLEELHITPLVSWYGADDA